MDSSISRKAAWNDCNRICIHSGIIFGLGEPEILTSPHVMRFCWLDGQEHIHGVLAGCEEANLRLLSIAASRGPFERLIPYNLDHTMPASLNQIVAATRQKLAEKQASVNIASIERQAEGHIPRGFRRALESVSRNRVAVIAELKKASPSRGLIRAEFDPVGIAKALERAGAAALSVLTDAEFFQGSLENLELASGAASLPCLRKDFILDELQIVEARAHHADAILLIVAALSATELSTLFCAARQWNLDVLCEVHDGDELGRALDAGADLIGVNSRDLRTFKVDLTTALDLGPSIPNHVVRVAESGIHNSEDMARLRATGYQAFLIGESLMKAADPGEALKALLSSELLMTANDRRPATRP